MRTTHSDLGQQRRTEMRAEIVHAQIQFDQVAKISHREEKLEIRIDQTTILQVEIFQRLDKTTEEKSNVRLEIGVGQIQFAKIDQSTEQSIEFGAKIGQNLRRGETIRIEIQNALKAENTKIWEC